MSEYVKQYGIKHTPIHSHNNCRGELPKKGTAKIPSNLHDNTHTSTEKSAAELLNGRKLPKLFLYDEEDPIDSYVRQNHDEEKLKQKMYFDKKARSTKLQPKETESNEFVTKATSNFCHNT